MSGEKTPALDGQRATGGYPFVKAVVLACLLVAIGVAGGSAPSPALAQASTSSGDWVGGEDPKARDDRFTATEDRTLTVRAAGVLRNDGGVRLSAAKASNPKHGRLSFRKNGSFVYTPHRNYSGSDTFAYNARNGAGKTDRATVRITVRAVNDAPVAGGDGYRTAEDQTLRVPAPGILRNDNDVDGGRLSAIQASGPRHGGLALARDGSFVYTPDNNHNGKDSFSYKAGDGAANSRAATVTISVSPVNDTPVAGDGAREMEENGPPITVDLGALVSDAETSDADLAYDIVSGPTAAEGELTGSGSTRTFDPAGNYDGVFDIVYTVTDRGDPDDCGAPGAPGAACDGPETSAQGKVTVTVNRVNEAPVITALTGGPGAAGVDEGNAAYAYDFTVTDGDPGDDFTVENGFPDCGTGGEYVAGSFQKNQAGDGGSFECRFVDGPNTPRVRIQVNDGEASSNVATTSGPTVNNVKPGVAFEAFDPDTGFNDATVGESATAKRTYTFTVTDPGQDTFSVVDGYPKCGANGALSGQVVTTATGGSFECVFPDGGPAGNPTTSDVEIKVKDSDDATDTDNRLVTVTVANEAPAATFNAPASVAEGEDIDVSLTDATDPAGSNDALEYRFKCGPADWTAYGASTTAACPTNDDGAVTVKGQVRDEDGGESAEYTQAVTVGNVAPTITSVTNDGPKDEGSPVTVTVAASDPAGADDPLSYEFDCDNDGAFGAASSQNTAQCTYASAGEKTVPVRVSDGDGGSITGFTTFTIRRVNAQPVAGDGAASVDEDAGPITIDFADFASDEETADADLTYDVTAPGPSEGTLTGTGSARDFTPADDFSGTVEILYTVTDRGDPDGCVATDPDCSAPKTSVQGKVTVTVRAVNDAPVLTVPATFNADEDVATDITGISASDADAGSGNVVLTISVSSGTLTADNGNGVTVGGSGSGALTLTGPVSNVNGFMTDSKVRFQTARDADADVELTATIDDGGNTGSGGAKTDTKTATIDVRPVNDAPVADDETFNGASRAVGNTSLVVNDADDGAPDPSGPEKTVTGDILDGDSDVDGPGPMAVQAGTFATNDGGQVTIQADGDFTFHPRAGTSCTDNSDFFDYTLTDQNPGTAGTDTGRVTVEIQDCVWYVDAAAPSGDGRSHSPFNSLAGINGAGGAGDADASGQKIFLHDGTYSGGLPLEGSQALFGQRHGLTVPDGGTGNVTLAPAEPGGGPSQVNGGLGLAANNNVQGVDLGTTGSAGVFALSGASVGTATVNTSTPGGIDNPAGGAVRIDGANNTLDMRFSGVTSNNSSTNAVSIAEAAGTFNASGGTLSGATGTTVQLTGNNSGDNLDFTYGGSISDDAGQLVSVSGQSGGTKDFNGNITDGNDGDGSGISLSNNAGATVRFDGGLTLSTGANNAFGATGGGTVSVTDPVGAVNNTVATTTGTALNVANTTIGSNGLTFERISANGGQNGIVLDSTGTSGGLTVTGTGTAGSGGTIQNSVGGDGATAGSGIHLQNTRNVSLAGMQLNGHANYAIRGSGVVNFALANSTINGTNGTNAGFDEGSVRFTELTGSASVTNSNISGGYENNFSVVNTSGALDRILFDAVTIGANGTAEGDDGLFLQANGTATIKATVEDSFLTAARGDLFQFSVRSGGANDLVFQRNALSNNHPNIVSGGGGFSITSSNTPSLTYNISNNTFRDAVGSNLVVGMDGTNGTFNGTINNNTIGVAGPTVAGSAQGHGIVVGGFLSGGTHTATITNNRVHDYTNNGIHAVAGEGGTGTGRLNLTIQGNTVAEPNPAGNFIFDAIRVVFGTATSFGNYTGCVTIGGASDALKNDVNNSAGQHTNEIRLFPRFTSKVYVPGFTPTGSPDADDAAMSAFLEANNVVNPGKANGNNSSTQAYGGTCPP